MYSLWSSWGIGIVSLGNSWAPSHCLNQCLHRSLTQYWGTQYRTVWWINNKCLDVFTRRALSNHTSTQPMEASIWPHDVLYVLIKAYYDPDKDSVPIQNNMLLLILQYIHILVYGICILFGSALFSCGCIVSSWGIHVIYLPFFQVCFTSQGDHQK